MSAIPDATAAFSRFEDATLGEGQKNHNALALTVKIQSDIINHGPVVDSPVLLPELATMMTSGFYADSLADAGATMSELSILVSMIDTDPVQGRFVVSSDSLFHFPQYCIA